MNVQAIVSVGNFSTEAHVEDCGPDALGDAMRQAIGATLTVLGSEDLRDALDAAPEEAGDGD